MSRQLSLLKDPRRKTKLWWVRKRHVYGGDMKYRKVARPFDFKKLSHAIFKAKLGRAVWFTRSQNSIRRLLNQMAARDHVQIRDVAINRDHIHVLFSARYRRDQAAFLRRFASQMGRKYKSIRGGRRPLWTSRPFTRLVSWGKKSLSDLAAYFEMNRQEALSLVPYTPRTHPLTEFLARWSKLRDFPGIGLPISIMNRSSN